MNKAKKMNMPVQGKAIPRYGSSSDYQSNVNPAFWGAIAGAAIPLVTNLVKKIF